jgi:hypothetical protein
MYQNQSQQAINNKPDITNHDNKQGMCMLIEVATPGDTNVIMTEGNKILK